MKNMERYLKNVETFSLNELADIHEKKVCILGCGGLGGYVIQVLSRFGVGSLTLVDGDVFNESHLNRQVFSNSYTLGLNKAEVAQKSLIAINPSVDAEAVPRKIVASNAKSILRDHDLVMDCLDCMQTRFAVVDACSELEIPIVHGASAGFYGQVANIFPGSNILSAIYSNREKQSALEEKLGTPSFIPLVIAGIQCSEALKLLAGRHNVLQQEMLSIDLYNNRFEVKNFD